MKIIVRNAEEKELIQKFIDALHESLLSEVEDADHKWASKNNDVPYLNSIEYSFIGEGLYNTTVEVDPKESPIQVEDDDIITGKCSVCGKHTEGTIDGDPVDYDEYLRLTSEESRKTWKCETCFRASYEVEEAV